METSSLQRTTYILLLGCIIIFILSVAKGFLIPLAWALMISLSSMNFIDRVQKKTKMKRMPLILLYILFLLFVTIAIFYFLVYEVKLIIFAVPELDVRLIELENNFIQWMAGVGIDIKDQLNFNYLTSKISENTDQLVSVAGGVGKQLGNIFLVLLYTFFFLYYKGIYMRFVELRVKGKKEVEHIRELTQGILQIVSNYLSGTLFMTFGLAVILYVMFLLMGIEYALFFSVFVAILNLIPYIGNPIGMVVVVLYAFLTEDGILIPILALIGINVANQIQENVLRPMILGDKLKLNAFMVFLSVILGSVLWGVAGMILFIPLAGIIKIILEDREQTRPFALFFGEIDEEKKEKKSLFRKKAE